MKRIIKKIQFPICSLLIVFVFTASCNGQKSTDLAATKTTDSVYAKASMIPVFGPKPNPMVSVQISQYITSMFQDRAGNIWFGTNGDGICRFDGTNYSFFTPSDLRSGFPADAVRAMTQDKDGNMWFATTNGVSRYDGKAFKNFNVNDGLVHRQVWSVLVDKSGILWFGTEGGVSRYDGKKFTDFKLPVALSDEFVKATPVVYPAPKLINSIVEDRSGNIWFASNGGGVYKYDGKSVTGLSKKDGLADNFVQRIYEDRKGILWFGTQFGGLSRYDGKRFMNLSTKNGLGNNFVWTILEDKNGRIWTGNAGGGLNCFDGFGFQHLGEQEGLGNRHVQSLLQDRSGKFWIGTSGGAYLFDGRGFTNIKREINAEDGC